VTCGHPATALIADDEPLLRDALERSLAAAWPALRVVARARNGREAVQQFEVLRPDVCFLDVHMPGLSGVQAAQQIGRRAHLVFVTAFDRYAVEAFSHGVLDYLVKPVEPARLAETVARLQERLATVQPARATEALLQELALRLQPRLRPGAPDPGVVSGAAPVPVPVALPGAVPGEGPLRWLRASVGTALRLIAVEDIDFLRSDVKYTLVAWRGDDQRPGEALVRMPLRDLLVQLDATQFVQVHRSVVVNLRSVGEVVRGDNETAEIRLKHRPEVLPVSRSYLHLFKQM